jgi:Zn-dependent protease with chaperone function
VQPSLVLIPLALEWVVIASTIAPLWLGLFSGRPRLGIFAWIALFASVVFASLTAIVVSVWAVLFNFVNLEQHEQDLPLTLFYSVAPWALFLMAGVAITLINQKLEPTLLGLKKLLATPVLPAKPLMKFQKVEVEVIELDVVFAIALQRPRPRILISRAALKSLGDEELNAVLWHEYGHLRQRHNAVKSLAKAVALLAGFVRASRVMSSEVTRLCEVAADHYAARRVPIELVRSARAKFD